MARAETTPILSEPEEILSSDALPQVTFDIALGKRYDYVDFDYDAYLEGLYEDGVDYSQAADLSIHFSTRRTLLNHATYDVRQKQIITYVKASDTDESLNGILAHETKHFTDDVAGDITKTDKFLNTLRITLMQVGILYAVGGVAMQMYGLSQDDLEVTQLALIPAVFGAASVLASLALHEKIKSEQRAGVAEESARPIVSFSKKQPTV